ncbi:uncharacterized protein LOC111025624 [Momordica charantia]|uniref:Uncharacterized protein LOC111025624 n=1 Tax=Momordica charantia TaxID=3673 RepID=A0A6J1DY08_MOMCH|nr:uncharacterized protein LOC111025624 [Momordica charantia]
MRTKCRNWLLDTQVSRVFWEGVGPLATVHPERPDLCYIRAQQFRAQTSGAVWESVSAEGCVSLPVTIGEGDQQVTKVAEFVVIDRSSVYNAIIGRPLIRDLRAVPSTYHQVLKYPTSAGIAKVRGEQKMSRECYAAAMKGTTTCAAVTGAAEPCADEPDPSRGTPAEELELVPLLGPEKQVSIGSRLRAEVKEELVSFLKANADVFAWSHDDMPGIDPSIMVHRLNVDPSYRPVRQKRRSVDPERILVKKPNGKWHVCIAFTSLNKACPKDSFPLPRIDQLVDATAGHELLSFMDAYSRYNQIRMHVPDQEHTDFVTDQGLYCYNVMPFGLKNAGATYQRMVNMMFVKQIGRNMEVYVDDMFV